MKCFGYAVSSLGVAILSSLTLSCSSHPTISERESDVAHVETEQSSAAEYEKILDKYSTGDTEYNGFYNSFGFHVAILNSEVIEASIKRQAFFYLWDQARIDSERDKAFKAASESTDVFLSFFTPDKRDDNLATEKSIWRVLLDVGGKRYVGKIKKLKRNLSELITLYPFHTRWNTAYLVSFPIMVSQAETQNSKLTITGPLGVRSVEFSAKSPSQ